MRRALLYPGTLGLDLLALLIAVIVRAAWGLSWRIDGGLLIVLLRPEALLSGAPAVLGPTWRGMCLGHVLFLAVPDPHVVSHERVHVEQFEAAGLCGLLIAVIVALCGVWPLAVFLFTAWPLAPYGAASLVAALRGENAYRGNHLEEAAYDATREQ